MWENTPAVQSSTSSREVLLSYQPRRQIEPCVAYKPLVVILSWSRRRPLRCSDQQFSPDDLPHLLSTYYWGGRRTGLIEVCWSPGVLDFYLKTLEVDFLSASGRLDCGDKAQCWGALGTGASPWSGTLAFTLSQTKSLPIRRTLSTNARQAFHACDEQKVLLHETRKNTWVLCFTGCKTRSEEQEF